MQQEIKKSISVLSAIAGLAVCIVTYRAVQKKPFTNNSERRYVQGLASPNYDAFRRWYRDISRTEPISEEQISKYPLLRRIETPDEGEESPAEVALEYGEATWNAATSPESASDLMGRTVGWMFFVRGRVFFRSYLKVLLTDTDPFYAKDGEKWIRDFGYSWETALDPYLVSGYRISPPVPTVIDPLIFDGGNISYSWESPPWRSAPEDWAPEVRRPKPTGQQRRPSTPDGPTV